jgi:hypothetical protein
MGCRSKVTGVGSQVAYPQMNVILIKLKAFEQRLTKNKDGMGESMHMEIMDNL